MKYLLLLVVISLAVYFLIWRSLTPFPLTLNWDIYEHITLANKISEGHLSFLPSKISDTFTFNGYSTLFQIFLSVPKILFHADLIKVYYYLEYGYFLLTIIATYLLAQSIFGSKFTGFIAGLFSIFIFENFMAYTSLFLIPQNLAATLSILVLYSLSKDKDHLFFYVVFCAIFIFLIHFIIGLLGIAAILGFIWLRKKPLILLNKLIIASLAFLLLMAGLNYIGGLEFTGREEAAHFTFSLVAKLSFLLDWYSLSLLFLPFAAYTIFQKGASGQKVILILAFLFLGLSISPVSYALKFFSFEHYFLNLVLAAGISILLINLPKLIRTLSVAWLTFALLIVFFKSESFYKEPLYFDGKQSHISQNELEAAKYLSNNFGSDALLLSDPSTQYILEAASGINTQGGAYATKETRKIIASLDLTKIRNIRDQLSYENVNRKKTLLALGGRFFAWRQLPQTQRLSFFYNIWQPRILEPQDHLYIDDLINNQNVKLLYSNKELVILEI